MPTMDPFANLQTDEVSGPQDESYKPVEKSSKVSVLRKPVQSEISSPAATSKLKAEKVYGEPKEPGRADIGSRTDGTQLSNAREKAKQGKWDEVTMLLAPVFAVNRIQEVGIILAESYVHQGKPEMAKGILDTLEFDRELMNDEMKEIIFKVGVALEGAGNFSDALELYDIICNVDINFNDVFDRSDRLYAKVKKR
ncbi:hypothetical protein HYY75_08425 [bacterium]|nr:hypothetical protein [bacterium]